MSDFDAKTLQDSKDNNLHIVPTHYFDSNGTKRNISDDIESKSLINVTDVTDGGTINNIIEAGGTPYYRHDYTENSTNKKVILLFSGIESSRGGMSFEFSGCKDGKIYQTSFIYGGSSFGTVTSQPYIYENKTAEQNNTEVSLVTRHDKYNYITRSECTMATFDSSSSFKLPLLLGDKLRYMPGFMGYNGSDMEFLARSGKWGSIVQYAQKATKYLKSGSEGSGGVYESIATALAGKNPTITETKAIGVASSGSPYLKNPSFQEVATWNGGDSSYTTLNRAKRIRTGYSGDEYLMPSINFTNNELRLIREQMFDGIIEFVNETSSPVYASIEPGNYISATNIKPWLGTACVRKIIPVGTSYIDIHATSTYLPHDLGAVDNEPVSEGRCLMISCGEYSSSLKFRVWILQTICRDIYFA